MRINLSLLWLVLIVGSFVLTSCAGAVRYKKTGQPAASTKTVVLKKGPPPHAPAHGYRHKHRNVIMVYESSLGVYIVDGHPGSYFHDGNFYRTHKGTWQMSLDIRGPWKKITKSKVPKGLHNHQHAKAKKQK